MADEKSPARSRDRHQCVRGSDNAHWQWSATENPDNPSNVYDVDFTDGDDDWDHKDNNSLSSRPVALEELDAPFSIFSGARLELRIMLIRLQE